MYSRYVEAMLVVFVCIWIMFVSGYTQSSSIYMPLSSIVSDNSLVMVFVVQYLLIETYLY